MLPKLKSRARPRRRSGIALLSLGTTMAASGYLLQVAVDEWWRELWVVVHVAVSLLWLGVLLGHCLSRRG